MDPQFQELAREIADAVESRVVDAIEKRLSGAFEERFTARFDDTKTHLEERINTRFEETKTHLEDRIKTHIDQFEKRAEERFDQFERRAEQRMQMHFEHLNDSVKLAAEGYGATLNKIERELVDLNKKVDRKFGDHDLALKDHGQRITALEKQR